MSALALGACVVDTDTDTGTPGTDAIASSAEPEPIGDAEEEVRADPNDVTVPLPYTERYFELRKVLNTKRFVLTAYSSIKVTASASWKGPVFCHVSQYTITMTNENGTPEGNKNYLIYGLNDVQSFQNVPPGKHYLHLEVGSPDEKQCVLVGHITIDHT